MTDDKKTQLKYYVTTFYKFFTWSEDKSAKEHGKALENWCLNKGIKGLIIVSPEGFNGTVASASDLDEFKDHLKKLSSSEINFKDSNTNDLSPFRRMKVKQRKEIVTLGKTEINPTSTKTEGVSHMSPEKWHKFISENPDVQLVDVRNDFEAEMGTFKHAQNWKMEKFTEFPKLVKETAFEKDKPVLMFCTGGIRCEKASLEMNSQGFKEIYQLDGGILNYLEKYPEGHFNGECFVFDHRVSVDKNLNPSEQYSLCTHCGQPGSKDKFNCRQCKIESYGVCKLCWDKDESLQTCSKNCAHHYTLGHNSTKIHKDSKRIKYGN